MKRVLLAFAVSFAFGLLLVACLWASDHPESVWAQLLVMLVLTSAPIVVCLPLLDRFASRQAGGRR